MSLLSFFNPFVTTFPPLNKNVLEWNRCLLKKKLIETKYRWYISRGRYSMCNNSSYRTTRGIVLCRDYSSERVKRNRDRHSKSFLCDDFIRVAAYFSRSSLGNRVPKWFVFTGRGRCILWKKWWQRKIGRGIWNNRVIRCNEILNSWKKEEKRIYLHT